MMRSPAVTRRGSVVVSVGAGLGWMIKSLGPSRQLDMLRGRADNAGMLPGSVGSNGNRASGRSTGSDSSHASRLSKVAFPAVR